MKSKLALLLLVIALSILTSVAVVLFLRTEHTKAEEAKQVADEHAALFSYLSEKGSPLADEVDTLLSQKHWRLIVALSAAESTFCKHQLGNNCWGITSIEGGYKSYPTLKEGIEDTDALITRWQERGRWLTVSDMNGHYVVPYNPSWERTVNAVLEDLDFTPPQE